MNRLLWTQKQGFGPAPRSGHALAYNSQHSCVVLFGGLALVPGGNGQEKASGDTWAWDGLNWTQVADIGPPPRQNFAMAFDRNRNRLVLFGGVDGNAALLGDTWEWDGQNWTQVADIGPAPRQSLAMAFDSSKNVVTFYGGQSAQATQNDTWVWDGQSWTQQDDAGPSRAQHAVAYDDNRQRLVLFGGNDSLALQYGDTWEWDGAAWKQRSDFGPPPCVNAQMVFTGSVCILFGGLGANGLLNETWSWDGTYWTARQDMGPATRQSHGLAFDSARRQVVLFGGAGPGAFVGDTWEQNADPAGQPPGGAPGAALTITSFAASVPPPLQEKFTTQISIHLSGAAPEGGVTITFSPISFSNQVVIFQGQQLAVPAGLDSVSSMVTLDFPGQALPPGTMLLATLPNGNSLQSNPIG